LIIEPDIDPVEALVLEAESHPVNEIDPAVLALEEHGEIDGGCTESRRLFWLNGDRMRPARRSRMKNEHQNQVRLDRRHDFGRIRLHCCLDDPVHHPNEAENAILCSITFSQISAALR
jgi:hypothetical protein